MPIVSIQISPSGEDFLLKWTSQDSFGNAILIKLVVTLQNGSQASSNSKPQKRLTNYCCGNLDRLSSLELNMMSRPESFVHNWIEWPETVLSGLWLLTKEECSPWEQKVFDLDKKKNQTLIRALLNNQSIISALYYYESWRSMGGLTNPLFFFLF